VSSDAEFNALPPEFEQRMKRKRARSREEREGETHEPTSQRWGPYELIELAGEGPTARVYRASREGDSSNFAVKILRRAVVQGAQTPGARADYLLGNASTIAQLRHPHLIHLKSIEVHDGKTGLVMPWIDGPTLDEALRGRRTLGVRQSLELGAALCDALATVHESELVHNDVEARNIVLLERGPLLMDVSSACEFGTEHGDRGIALSGSPQFMAPELLEGRSPTVKSDLYSVGAVLFLALSGRHAIKGPMVGQLREAHARGDRKRLHELMPNLPNAVCALVESALAKNPAERPQSAREFGAALSNLASTDLEALQRQDRGAMARWWGGLPSVVRAALILGGVAAFIWLISRNR